MAKQAEEEKRNMLIGKAMSAPIRYGAAGTALGAAVGEGLAMGGSIEGGLAALLGGACVGAACGLGVVPVQAFRALSTHLKRNTTKNWKNVKSKTNRFYHHNMLQQSNKSEKEAALQMFQNITNVKKEKRHEFSRFTKVSSDLKMYLKHNQNVTNKPALKQAIKKYYPDLENRMNKMDAKR